LTGRRARRPATEERAELAALRKELRIVKTERDILGTAAAFFAKATT